MLKGVYLGSSPKSFCFLLPLIWGNEKVHQTIIKLAWQKTLTEWRTVQAIEDAGNSVSAQDKRQ
jgi:hypothetical protein